MASHDSYSQVKDSIDKSQRYRSHEHEETIKVDQMKTAKKLSNSIDEKVSWEIVAKILKDNQKVRCRNVVEAIATITRHFKVAKVKNAAWNCTFLRTELVFFFRHIFFLFLWVSGKKSTLWNSRSPVYLSLFSPMTLSFFFRFAGQVLRRRLLTKTTPKSIWSATNREKRQKCKEN